MKQEEDISSGQGGKVKEESFVSGYTRMPRKRNEVILVFLFTFSQDERMRSDTLYYFRSANQLG